MLKQLLTSTIAILLFINIGFSQISRDSVLVKTSIFTVMYSEKLEQPLWVKYTAKPIIKVADRKGMDFYKEKDYITSDNNDYKGTPYDKGHMAPAAHFTDSKENLKQTFTYLNSALQRDKLNRGEWRFLEAAERKWADVQQLDVHIKVVFDNKPNRVSGGAAIPQGFWKTIYFTKGDSTHVYYFPNQVPDKKWTEYRIK
jgi:endonuclease G